MDIQPPLATRPATHAGQSSPTDGHGAETSIGRLTIMRLPMRWRERQQRLWEYSSNGSTALTGAGAEYRHYPGLGGRHSSALKPLLMPD